MAERYVWRATPWSVVRMELSLEDGTTGADGAATSRVTRGIARGHERSGQPPGRAARLTADRP
jgi:hypothetical protein